MWWRALRPRAHLEPGKFSLSVAWTSPVVRDRFARNPPTRCTLDGIAWVLVPGSGRRRDEARGTCSASLPHAAHPIPHAGVRGPRSKWKGCRSCVHRSPPSMERRPGELFTRGRLRVEGMHAFPTFVERCFQLGSRSNDRGSPAGPRDPRLTDRKCGSISSTCRPTCSGCRNGRAKSLPPDPHRTACLE